MRFLFIVQSLRGASSRYRALQFIPWLARAGAAVEVAAAPSNWFERRRLCARAGEFDLVFLQKRTFDRVCLALLRRRARRLVFDVDDAIWARDDGSRSRKRAARFASACRAADAVFAGNDYLAEAAAAHARRVETFPTVVDLARYPDAPSETDPNHFTLGWIGGRGTLPYLEAIAGVIDSLADDIPGLRLKVICDRFPRLERVPVVETRWSEETEAAELASIDVGLMPLPDNAWTRGKCGLKILQYFAARRPAICSPVGVNAELVIPGETGLHASSAAEWRDAMRALAADPSARRRMGAAGRARVAECYSLEALAPRWTQTLLDLAG